MISLEEKRVYSDKREHSLAYVATGLGLVAVEMVEERVGGFSVVHRGTTRDVATADGLVVAATAEDVVVRGADGESFEPLGFGPATAVGFADGDLLVAGADGALTRVADDEREPVATLDSPVHAIDGDLLATPDGVYRVTADGVSYAGLSAVADVSVVGVPLAATANGLYRLGNGWMDALDGTFTAVSAEAATATPGTLGRAHAVSAGVLYAHDAGEWSALDLPVDEAAVDVAYGEGLYVVTDAGTFLARAGDGWRAQALGVRDVRALAVA